MVLGGNQRHFMELGRNPWLRTACNTSYGVNSVWNRQQVGVLSHKITKCCVEVGFWRLLRPFEESLVRRWSNREIYRFGRNSP